MRRFVASTIAGEAVDSSLFYPLAFLNSGIMPNDLAQNPAEGFLINPPDLRSNTQRVFVPRASLTSVTVIAVIGAARRRRKGPPDTRQVTLFEQ